MGLPGQDRIFHYSVYNISMANALVYSFNWLRLDRGSMEVTDKTSGSRVTVSSSLYMLEFNPLHTSGGRQYQCVVTVMSGGAAVNITDEINLNVTCK